MEPFLIKVSPSLIPGSMVAEVTHRDLWGTGDVLETQVCVAESRRSGLDARYQAYKMIKRRHPAITQADIEAIPALFRFGK